MEQQPDHAYIWQQEKPSGGVIGGNAEQVQVQEKYISEDASEKHGTNADREDMHRMGKMQETRRNFSTPTIIAFSMIALGTWEAELR